MSLTMDVESSFFTALPELGVEWQGAPVSAPELLVLNDELAVALGLDVEALRSPEGVAVLAGNAAPAGSTPIAMAYAGHQFGGYAPRLGDGRALLVGELIDPEGNRWDLHLKGSGRTPFARGGDGRAAVGPMLREHLIAEAMHALGIPTTRALAVVATGEPVHRDDGPLPGAVLTRVAASHLRVGTFEYAARLDDPTLVARLVDHAIQRHHPELVDAPVPALALLDATVEAQASLVARWMLVGFIHGVMNTDNTTISGETIDYGPCAFMDRYDPATVYSSIDHAGRYAFANQPAIAAWNLARLAETLLPLIDDDEQASIDAAMGVLNGFADRFHEHWLAGMAAKLGLVAPTDGDLDLANGLLELLHTHRADHTTAFRALAAWVRGDEAGLRALIDDEALDAWAERWRARLDVDGRDARVVAAAMDAVNPIYVPRNHLVEAALTAGSAGDLGPFLELTSVLAEPFTERPGLERFAQPGAEDFDAGYQTFCGT